MKLFFWYKKRWVTVLIYFVLGVTIIIAFRHLFYEPETISCYRIKTMKSLPDISEISPRKGKSIFFHETSCQSYLRKKIFIQARQACALESAARLNPNFDIYLLYASPGVIEYEGDQSDRILQVLLSYKNIKIYHMDYEKYIKDTPVEGLYSSGKLENSLHVVAHSSDIVRYVTLWKYGGIYMDLDVIVLKSLEDLQPNYAGIESKEVVASGVMNFEPDGQGHKMVDRCLNDLKEKFDGKAWSDNGPGVITRLLMAMCSANVTADMLKNDCGGFHPLPTKTFYPVPWPKWNMYFEEKYMADVLNMTQESLIIHVWNKLSHAANISLNSNVPYLFFAKKYCPNVVKACDVEF